MNKTVIAIEPNEFERNFNYQLAPFEAWCASNGLHTSQKINSILRYLVARIACPHYDIDSQKAYLFFTGAASIRCGGFPYYLTSEIIPMIWDCWPKYFDLVCDFMKRCRVRTCIFTSSVNAIKIKNVFPHMNVLFIPEGVTTNLYEKGGRLVERRIDIMEYGRPSGILLKNGWDDGLIHLKSHKGKPLFPSVEDFHKNLADTKLTFAFPRCDTQPEVAGNLETLTQRYWENMLSRVLMVGRAPKELVELIGYNPVINIDPNNTEEQILNIIQHIDAYQEFVDRNRVTAIKYAGWDMRIKEIKTFLITNNYKV